MVSTYVCRNLINEKGVFVSLFALCFDPAMFLITARPSVPRSTLELICRFIECAMCKFADRETAIINRQFPKRLHEIHW